MFKTFEEVQAKYPIGTKINYTKETMSHRFLYTRPEDIIEYRKLYESVEVIDENLVECFWDIEHYDLVDGYIFSGANSNWYPATITWDGWLPINITKEDEKCLITE